MSQNFINLFKASCIRLAHTVVVNHPYAGIAINKRLEIEGFGKYTRENDKSTWKYYLNMAGIYHAYDMVKIHKINKAKGLGTAPGIDQTKMIIRVAGDEGTIEKEFTLENISGLTSDENLAADYQVGTINYNELLDTYPDFELLIKGILHPIPLQTSINAEDYAILYCGGYYRTRLPTLHSEYAFIKGEGLIYDEITLIEEYEADLIYKIEEFTKIFFRQHDNNTYAEFNDLYFAASIGIYYLNLPATIFNIRLESVKTSEVHTMHVQFHLDSHANIGQYMSYLTRKQQMYLYRNVEWLSCNSGKQKVFDDLIENFLKDSGIAVIFYNGYHNDSTITEEGDPTPVYVREYEEGLRLIDTRTKFSTEEIIELESNVARDNAKNKKDQTIRATDLSEVSPSSKYKTKIIETHLNRQSLASYITKEEFLFNNWIYSAIKGEYTGLIGIGFPNTKNKLQLTIRSAALLFYYCYAKGFMNHTPRELPEFLLHHIPKTMVEVGDLETLKQRISDPKFTEAELIELYQLNPEQRRYYSSGHFKREMEKRWDEFNTRNYVAHKNGFIRASAQIKGMIEYLYLIERVQFPFNKTFDTWIPSLGGSIQNMSTTELQRIASAIINEVLGIDLNALENLTKVHRALINIVKTFSSYNIQFVSKTAAGEFSNLGVNYPRMENMKSSYGANEYIYIHNYPEYQSDQASAITNTRYGFNHVYESHGPEKLLSQEQIKILILTEQNEGINVGAP